MFSYILLLCYVAKTIHPSCYKIVLTSAAKMLQYPCQMREQSRGEIGTTPNLLRWERGVDRFA